MIFFFYDAGKNLKTKQNTMTESVHSRTDPVKRIGLGQIAAHEEVCTE